MSSERIKASDLRELVKEQSHRCALTGRELEPITAAADHIIPVSRNGSHGISNIQVLHHDVNRAKGTMTNKEFVEMCVEVAVYVGGCAPCDRQNEMVYTSRMSGN